MPNCEGRPDVEGNDTGGTGYLEGLEMADPSYGDVREWAVVRRPGAENAVHLRGEIALARRRGRTMAELARTFSAEKVTANVERRGRGDVEICVVS